MSPRLRSTLLERARHLQQFYTASLRSATSPFLVSGAHIAIARIHMSSSCEKHHMRPYRALRTPPRNTLLVFCKKAVALLNALFLITQYTMSVIDATAWPGGHSFAHQATYLFFVLLTHFRDQCISTRMEHACSSPSKCLRELY